MKIKPGIIVFLTMSAANGSKGEIQATPLHPVGDGEGGFLSSPTLTPSPAAKQDLYQ